ncbi:hypothetical protein ACHHYP_10424 [Achlya hypogyna]|uniref:Cap-specific mRNA (nucleoside-2'-O-)-methyltransferase 1 n=1 Tax=Achlya hypogyna TaxID=1202772 RepID=A0A1V9YLE9_ACHHY|nr:hypothetical protein ACHHYP_10424 [Achlya hypogyna]
MDGDMAAAMGFTSFGKRKRRSSPTRRSKISAAAGYVMTPVEFLAQVEAKDIVLELTTDGDDEAGLMPELTAALDELVELKESLEDLNLTPGSFRKYRARANPYEHLGKGCFLNRSAMKMAELDARLGLASAEACSFADLCGAPGGFSEYLVYRTAQGFVRGFGMSIRPDDANDPLQWRLDDVTQVKVDISYGRDGTGDIYETDNALKEYPKGLDLVVADGGFQEARDRSNQEQLMHRLVLCETLAMTRLLREEGHFLCKTFELSTDFSVGLLYILHLHFAKIAIVKPLTSRPGSSERYIVGLGWKAFQPAHVIRHLTAANTAFAAGKVVRSLVSRDVWGADTAFVKFVERSGVAWVQAARCDAYGNAHRIASRQVKALHDIITVSEGRAVGSTTRLTT